MLSWAVQGYGEESCLHCHPQQSPRSHGAVPCSRCHGGQPEASQQEAAHRHLLAKPGTPETLAASCGSCHPKQVAAVPQSPMYTGQGIVSTTRRLLGDSAGAGGFATLGHSLPDQLLRKQCAACHLGSDRAARQGSAPGMVRRGGCLGCHLQPDEPATHPQLNARVGDEHCLGCHSRSGRMALSYAGLAEIEERQAAGEETGYLADGRLVARRQDDVHHRAGMACIDCHTRAGLMGATQGVDIRCEDCHANPKPRLRFDQWPEAEAAMKRRIPFPVRPNQEFLVTARHGTPLWHIEVRPTGLFLHRKQVGGSLRIPPYAAACRDPKHERLHCTACHSRWAPQCYGCHLDYAPEPFQWDALAGRQTPGRWVEHRWEIRNEPPPLGVRADGRIAPAVPGMILSLQPSEGAPRRFLRRFAFLDPHTTGAARTCVSCHRSPVALGLGEGTLLIEAGRWRFLPAHGKLPDGLPADAWTTLDGSLSGSTPDGQGRPLNPAELHRILSAP